MLTLVCLQGLREGGRGQQICMTIVETARQCNLQNDVALPADEEAAKNLTVRNPQFDCHISACSPYPLVVQW